MTPSKLTSITAKLEDIQEALGGIARKLEEIRNPIPSPEPAAQNPAPLLPRDFFSHLRNQGEDPEVRHCSCQRRHVQHSRNEGHGQEIQ
jgi:hypothetical protein